VEFLWGFLVFVFVFFPLFLFLHCFCQLVLIHRNLTEVPLPIRFQLLGAISNACKYQEKTVYLPVPQQIEMLNPDGESSVSKT